MRAGAGQGAATARGYRVAGHPNKCRHCDREARPKREAIQSGLFRRATPLDCFVGVRLLEALDGNPRARAFFDTLDGRNRYAILHRIQTAKRAETRARRIEKFVAMLDAGETIY